jgi:hypothetical protein
LLQLGTSPCDVLPNSVLGERPLALDINTRSAVVDAQVSTLAEGDARSGSPEGGAQVQLKGCISA